MKKNKLSLLILLSLFFLNAVSLSAQDFSEVCKGCEVFYKLHEALAQKDKVKKVDLSMQKIKTLPITIAELDNLECLDLSFNTFSILPAEFAQLKNLTYLNLTGTRYLAKIPAVLKELPNLKILDLRDHPEWNKIVIEEAKKLLPNVKIITQ